MLRFHLAFYFSTVILCLYSLKADVLTSENTDESNQEFQKILAETLEKEREAKEQKQKQCERTYNNRYNNRWKCCDGRAHYAPSRWISYQCCGDRAYVPTSHLCCGNEIQKKVIGSGAGAATIGIKKCCAGKNPYEPGKELCCDGEVLNSIEYGCCRNVKYNRAFATCCAGEVTPVLAVSPDARISCCASEAYDLNEKICCAGVLNNFTGDGKYNKEDTKCCDTKTYDSRSKVCCNGIKEKQSSLTECCFGRLIDPSKNICCNYGIQELAYGKADTGCCRFDHYRKGLKDYFELYNKQTQICCGGKLVDRVGQKTSCCIQQPYNVDNHVCCGGRLYKKIAGRCDNYRCCGKRMYCSDKLICCAGTYDGGVLHRERVYRKKRHSRCCGWRMYDRSAQKCETNNKLVKL